MISVPHGAAPVQGAEFAQPDPPPIGVTGAAEFDIVGVKDGEFEPDGVTDGVTVRDVETVCDGVRDEVGDCVSVDVVEEDEPGDAVTVDDGVCDGVSEAEHVTPTARPVE